VDPDEVLRQILGACEDGYPWQALESALHLIEWLSNGGYRPLQLDLMMIDIGKVLDRRMEG
jgi:hypothetical protein